jgi:hypothetical protein
MGVGKQFELDLKNGIMEHTAESVVAVRPDFSGSSKFSVADVIVLYENDYGLTGTFLELKKRNVDKGSRAVVMGGSSKGQNGMDELRTLIDGTPSWAEAALGLKFDHRQLLIIEADHLLYALENDLQFDQHGLEARETRGGNISMRKSGRIVSQQAGDPPWLACCKQIGVRKGDYTEA